MGEPFWMIVLVHYVSPLCVEAHTKLGEVDDHPSPTTFSRTQMSVFCSLQHRAEEIYVIVYFPICAKLGTLKIFGGINRVLWTIASGTYNA